MKHIKSYENIFNNIKPQIGDYVICHEPNINLKKFIENNIGQIDKIDSDFLNKFGANLYYVKYNNIPEKLLTKYHSLLLDNNRAVFEDEILHKSKYKEKLEIILKQNKFNL